MLISIPLVYFFVQEQPSPKVFAAFQSDSQPSIPIAPGLATSAPSYRRDPRFWLCVVGGILNAFCAFGLLNWLPSYFNRAKGIDFEQLGWPLALVFTAGIVGIGLMAYWGDRLQHRIRLAGWGFLAAALMAYIASNVSSLALLVLFFALAVFCQSAYAAQEYAIVQRLLPVDRVGAGTGLYNGLSILFGGVGGSLIPGSIVAVTGSFEGGILSIIIGAVLAAGVMFTLSLLMRY